MTDGIVCFIAVFIGSFVWVRVCLPHDKWPTIIFMTIGMWGIVLLTFVVTWPYFQGIARIFFPV